MSAQFGRLYASTARSSVPPEQLLRAFLLQALYSVRSERMLMEQLLYSQPFRWFVGLSMGDAVWVPTLFAMSRVRLLAGDTAQQFFADVTGEGRELGLVCDDHFTVIVICWGRGRVTSAS